MKGVHAAKSEIQPWEINANLAAGVRVELSSGTDITQLRLSSRVLRFAACILTSFSFPAAKGNQFCREGNGMEINNRLWISKEPQL